MSFIDEMEEVSEEVSQWAADLVLEITRNLSPNERPFGQQPTSKDEQIADYLEIKGDPVAWTNKINSMLEEMVVSLQTSGVGPDEISAISPRDIVVANAMDYSKRMEAMLRDD